MFLKQNIWPKYAPARRINHTVTPPLQFTLYLPLLGGAYFGQIFCFQNPSKNQTTEILVQNYSRCLISISLLYGFIGIFWGIWIAKSFSLVPLGCWQLLLGYEAAFPWDVVGNQIILFHGFPIHVPYNIPREPNYWIFCNEAMDHCKHVLGPIIWFPM